MRVAADLDPQRIISEHVFDGKTEEEVDIRYQSVKVVGNGSFGVVFQIRLVDTAKDAAIKRVLQDKRFKASSPFHSKLMIESRIANYEINFSSKRR
jgi:serine/threonine protein kinase